MCPSAGCMCGEIGFRFKPLEEELICHFLWNKMIGNDHLVRAISEVDFCKFEPWELPRQSAVKSEDKFWYFFYQLDFKYNNSTRASRLTKAGFWKATGRDRAVTDPGTNQEIARKKTLVFHEGRVPNGVATRWIIHEYRATPAATPPNPRPYVLCRLERKPAEKNSSPQKGEPGSSNSASTSKMAVDADNGTEAGLRLREIQDPISGHNSMDFELALQASMQEQGISLEDLLKPDDDSNNHQNRVQDEDPFSVDLWPDGFSVEEEDEFVNSMLVDDDDDEYFSQETVHTRLHDHTPSQSWTGEMKNEVVNVQNQPVYDCASSDDSTAATSYKLNSVDLVQGGLPINRRANKSQYQPRSLTLAEEVPTRFKLKSEVLGQETAIRDKERIREAGLRGGSFESDSSSRRGSYRFLEMNQLTCAPRPPSEYICNLVLGVILLIVIVADIAFSH